jgi:hypothetical protein
MVVDLGFVSSSHNQTYVVFFDSLVVEISLRGVRGRRRRREPAVRGSVREGNAH